MYFTLYLDVLFLVNFLMDYLVLRLVRKVRREPPARIRCMLGGALGAFGVCLSLCLPIHRTPVSMLPVHVVTSTIMVKIGCKIRNVRDLIGGVMAAYLTAFLWGGMFFVLYQGQSSIQLHTFLFLSVITYELSDAGVVFYRRALRQRGHYCEVTLYVEEKSKKVKGLYDTGNLLMDTFSGKPVSVVDRTAVEELFATPPEYNEALKPHYISYHAIGTDQGILLAVTIDGMRIDMQGKQYEITRPVLALSEGNVSFTQHYQLILNPNLIDDQEEKRK